MQFIENVYSGGGSGVTSPLCSIRWEKCVFITTFLQNLSFRPPLQQCCRTVPKKIESPRQSCSIKNKNES